MDKNDRRRTMRIREGKRKGNKRDRRAVGRGGTRR